MSEMPSIVLVIGDIQLGKNTIVKAKKKYSSYHWETVSASETSCDEMRMIAGFREFGKPKKAVLIQDIPNKKQIREFLSDLVRSNSETLKFVLWDSDSQIKIDPKKGMNKTWESWISDLKSNKGFTLINNGYDFAENDSVGCVSYVVDLFLKRNRKINTDVAQVFVDMVGKNRAMLITEISKLCIIAPEVITHDFIINNTFPTSKEAILYKFGNELDSGNLKNAIVCLENFLDNGVNANVLAQIMMNKARWNLAICHLWSEGKDWNSIKNEVLDMGKFPSIIWHNDQIPLAQKKKLAVECSIPEDMENFMVRKMGIPYDYIDIPKPKTKPNKVVKTGEIIPLPFMADIMINSVRKNVIAPNVKKYPEAQLRKLVLYRAIKVYLYLSDSLKQIRYSQESQKESLYEMVKTWVDISL